MHNYVQMSNDILCDFPKETKIFFFTTNNVEQNFLKENLNHLLSQTI